MKRKLLKRMKSNSLFSFKKQYQARLCSSEVEMVEIEEKELKIRIDKDKKEVKCKWIYPKGMNLEEAKAPFVLLHGTFDNNTSSWKKHPYNLCATMYSPVFLYEREGYSELEDNQFSEKKIKINKNNNFNNWGFDYLDHYATSELPSLLSAVGFGSDGNLYDPILYGHQDGALISLIYTSWIKKKR